MSHESTKNAMGCDWKFQREHMRPEEKYRQYVVVELKKHQF